MNTGEMYVPMREGLKVTKEKRWSVMDSSDGLRQPTRARCSSSPPNKVKT